MSSATSITKLFAEPFDPFDIEWRVQSVGRNSQGKLYAMVIPYVTNRAIQERLDDVCTPEGWYNKFEYPSDKAVTCGISIRFGTGENEKWITKWDGAEETKVEAVKGGLSSAMKRAAVQWGIGRYLYRLESAWVSPVDKQPSNLSDYIVAQVNIEGKKTRIYFQRPKLPLWALPKTEDEQAA